MTMRPRGLRPAARRAAGLAVLVCLGLGGCSAAGTAARDDEARAETLAEQLGQHLTEARLPALDTSTAVTLYGTDGGVSCENAGELQHELSLAQFGNNSHHLWRVVMDPELVAYDLAVVETYCPDKLDAFRKVIEGLGTEETIPTP